MTKQCICEICTCGRHRCSHRPANLLNQEGQPCVLTEYSNTYKGHPIPPRESFKPREEPMRGGDFMDKTTNRTDYIPHPMDKPYVHMPEQYRKPEGEMNHQTSYNKDYVERHGAPARAIKHDGGRQVPGKFEGTPTYKADYRRWDGSGRQPAYGQQAAWKPSEAPFEGRTTNQSDFIRYAQGPRQSYKPDERARISDEPFEDRTGYRDYYKQHPIPPRFQREREVYKPSGVPLQDQTTFKSDFRGLPGDRTHSFKPDNAAVQSDAPFDDGTTQRISYQRWPIERPFVHQPEQYQKPEGSMEMNTTHQATYKQLPIERVVAHRPSSAAQNRNAPFYGETNYHSDYKKWVADRARPMQQPDYVPNQAPFQGDSTYKKHYVAHPGGPPKSFRPDGRAVMSDAPFDDHTMYRTDYTNKGIQICEAASLDNPASRYQFVDFDTRGHKQYTQTTIHELPRNHIKSPMRPQALSVA